MTELEDWNCCGASSAHAFDHTLAIALPARTLSQAQSFDRDLVIPCAACYNRLKGADLAMRNDPATRSEMESILGFQYTGSVAVRPVLAVLAEDVGGRRISEEVRHPLYGLKVVTYYGCLLVRPPEIAQFDDPDNPQVRRNCCVLSARKSCHGHMQRTAVVVVYRSAVLTWYRILLDDWQSARVKQVQMQLDSALRIILKRQRLLANENRSRKLTADQ